MTVDMLYTLTVYTVVADYGGRGQVMSTVDVRRHPLITLSVQLCVQLSDGRFGGRDSIARSIGFS